jgi:glycosyltransferase involved in cell wall biosynthesis
MSETDPPRILNTMNDPRIGGPQLRAQSVATQLQNRDIETEFLLPNGVDSFEAMATDNGFRVHRPDISRIHPPTDLRANAEYILTYPLAVKRVYDLIEEREIDVVHTNMSLSFIPAVAAAQSSASLAWHFNDALVPKPIKNIAARAAMTLADEIVVASESVAEYYFPDHVDTTTIHAPVDVTTFDPETVTPSDSLTETTDADNPIVVGSVGNLNPIKGHEYFIRAIAQLTQQLDRPLVAPIVGAKLDSRTEYYRELVDLCAELGVSENVVFLGNRDDIPDLMARFDVFVLSSIAEACPMVVLEAMAMECPVVATRVGGVPEQITDGEEGWVVPPESPSQLATAIDAVLEDRDEATRRAKKARQRVCSTFSLDHCVTRHEQLYRSLI